MRRRGRPSAQRRRTCSSTWYPLGCLIVGPQGSSSRLDAAFLRWAEPSRPACHSARRARRLLGAMARKTREGAWRIRVRVCYAAAFLGRGARVGRKRLIGPSAVTHFLDCRDRREPGLGAGHPPAGEPGIGLPYRREVEHGAAHARRSGSAGRVALERVPAGIALRRQKLLRVATSTPGQPEEIALVDACVSSLSHVGARALWQPGTISELAVTFAEPDAIGLSSVAGLLHPVGRQEPQGLLLRLAPPRSAQARMTVAAPIAPGLIAEVGVDALEVLVPGRAIALQARSGTLALDGERELEFSDAELAVTLDLCGPFTIDVPATLSWAARHGVLRTDDKVHGNGSPHREEPLFT